MHACAMPGCYRCKLASIQISPSATPSRRNNTPPRRPDNPYEKGVHRHPNGAPVRKDGKVIGLAQKSSSEVDRLLRDRSERAQSLRRT